MFIPFCVYHYDTYMPLRRAHAHTCPQGSLMTPLWAEEAHTLGLGPNLTILPYLGLLLAFRASLVSARCRMVHRYGADIGVLTNYGQIGAALSTVSHIQAPSGQLLPHSHKPCQQQQQDMRIVEQMHIKAKKSKETSMNRSPRE